MVILCSGTGIKSPLGAWVLSRWGGEQHHEHRGVGCKDVKDGAYLQEGKAVSLYSTAYLATHPVDGVWKFCPHNLPVFQPSPRCQ